MSMQSLIEYSDNCPKTSGLWQYYRDEPSAALRNFESFKFKVRMTESTTADGNTKDVKIAMPLK